MPGSGDRRPGGALIWRAAALAMVLAGAGILAMAIAPPGAVASLLGPLSADGAVEGLGAGVRMRGRILGPLVLAVGAAAWWGRHAAGDWLDPALRELARRTGAGVSRGWRALRSGNAVALSLLVIVLAGSGLRIAHAAEPVEYDEAWTVIEFVSRPAPVGLTHQREANNHVLHTLLARPFFVMAGYRMEWIRVPVLVAGILLLPLAFLLGRAAQGPGVGLSLAALSVAAGPVLLYSVRARGYAMVTLAFVTLLILAFDLLASGPGAGRAGSWLAFAVTAALGAFVTPAMIYPFLVVVAWMAMDAAARAPAGGAAPFLSGLAAAVGATGVLTFLLYTPLLLFSGPAALVRPPFAAPVSRDAFLAHYGAAEPWQSLGSFLAEPFPTWAAVLLGGLAVGGALVHGRGSTRPVSPLAGMLILPVFVFLQGVLPPDRIWAFLTPLLLLSASTGLVWLWTRVDRGPAGLRTTIVWIPAGVAVMLAGLVEWRSDFFDKARHLAGYDRPELVAECLTEHVGPEDSVIAKGVLYWPTRFLFRARGFDESRINAHRRPGFTGRMMFLTVHDPLEVAVALESAETTAPWHARYARTVDRCGNATLQEVASRSQGEDWRRLGPGPGA